MIDIDRIFVKLDYLAYDITSHHKDYMERIYHLPPPWSNIQKVTFQARIKRLQCDLYELDKHVKIIESEENFVVNDRLYERLVEWRIKNQKLLNNVIMLILEANGYISPESKNLNTTVLPQSNIPSFNNETTFIKTATSLIYKDTVKVVTSETAVIDNTTCRNGSFNINQAVTTKTDDICILKPHQPPISTIVDYQLKLEKCNVEISSNRGSGVQKEFQRQNKYVRPPSSLTTDTDVIVDRTQEKLKQCPHSSHTSKFKERCPVELEQQIQIKPSQESSCATEMLTKPSTFWSRECLVKHSKKSFVLWLEKKCYSSDEKVVHSATDELKTEFVIQPKLGCLKQWKDKPPEHLIIYQALKKVEQSFRHLQLMKLLSIKTLLQILIIKVYFSWVLPPGVS